MNKAQQLMNYKDRISKLEQEESREIGKKQLQEKELLSSFQCKTIREGNHEFDKMEKEFIKKEKDYSEQIEELERIFTSQVH
jgi:hypothetical protein